MSFLKKLVPTVILTVALSSLCIGAASATSIGVGTVTDGGLRLRAEASTDSTILDLAPEGAHVVVLEKTGDGWYKVDFDTTVGYMSSDYITVETKADVKIGYGKVQTEGSTLNVRSGPSTDCDRVAILDDETIVSIVGMDSGWFKIEYKDITGYVRSDYMVTCKESANSRSGDAGKSAPAPVQKTSSTPVASSPIGQQVVDYASQFLGVPYVYGANGPNSFDCSGFTKYVYAHFGYTLNRSASGQLSNGVAVSRDQLQPGDLVFFYNGKVSTPVSHVGIYVGGGRFIHASTNDYAVEYNDLSSGYYSRVFVYARRIF